MSARLLMMYLYLRESRIGGISNIVDSTVCNCIINDCVYCEGFCSSQCNNKWQRMLC